MVEVWQESRFLFSTLPGEVKVELVELGVEEEEEPCPLFLDYDHLKNHLLNGCESKKKGTSQILMQIILSMGPQWFDSKVH